MACASRGIDFKEEIETGSGFSDIIIDNYDTKTACILELKKTETLEDCYAAAEKATKQIMQKEYASKYVSRRYKKVFGIGIGFAKKRCEVVSLGNLIDAKPTVNN